MQLDRVSRPTPPPPPVPESAPPEAPPEEEPAPPQYDIPADKISGDDMATRRLDVKTVQELEALRSQTTKEMKPAGEAVTPPPPPPEPHEMDTEPEEAEYEIEAEAEYEEPTEVQAAEQSPAPEMSMEMEAPSEGPEMDMGVPEPPSMEMEVEAEPSEPEEASSWQVDAAPQEEAYVPPEVPQPETPAPSPAPVEPAEKTSTEVKPPPGFKKEKPGFGFDQYEKPDGMSEEDAQKHDEARRFARLLISEIKLYNETKVAQGKQSNSIYEILKEDIDRSFQLYQERIPVDVRKAADYFKQSLVSILADGQESALGEMPIAE